MVRHLYSEYNAEIYMLKKLVSTLERTRHTLSMTVMEPELSCSICTLDRGSCSRQNLLLKITSKRRLLGLKSIVNISQNFKIVIVIESASS